jgi:hypothetical protein
VKVPICCSSVSLLFSAFYAGLVLLKQAFVFGYFCGLTVRRCLSHELFSVCRDISAFMDCGLFPHLLSNVFILNVVCSCYSKWVLCYVIPLNLKLRYTQVHILWRVWKTRRASWLSNLYVHLSNFISSSYKMFLKKCHLTRCSSSQTEKTGNCHGLLSRAHVPNRVWSQSDVTAHRTDLRRFTWIRPQAVL